MQARHLDADLVELHFREPELSAEADVVAGDPSASDRDEERRGLAESVEQLGEIGEVLSVVLAGEEDRTPDRNDDRAGAGATGGRHSPGGEKCHRISDSVRRTQEGRGLPVGERMAGIDAAKQAAARHAVERYVRPRLRLALGTGSTAAFAVRALADRFSDAHLDCVASSRATEDLARSLGIAVRPLRGDDRFDVMLDGADEVSPGLDLTKGGGGALLREKLLARLSEEVIIMVDPGKLVRGLGERSPIPVEVVPFAAPVVEREAAAMGYDVRRRAGSDGAPFRTDNGNEILDLVPREPLQSPDEADATLRHLVGVVETGIFVELADVVVVGHPDGSVEERTRPLARTR
jgi:ribose 5-phosphate isomerase A